ncbi:hypothetical protein BH23BAC1_BH23BAC1_12540 [soil metagenome]
MRNPTTLLSEKDIFYNRNIEPVKVLLVDDKKETLYSLEKLLEDDEYKIQFIKCTSGNDALGIALREDLALILLDVQMPEMDGYEVARYLKQNKKTSSTPLIFVTALDHEVNYILEGYKKGAVDYLFKPLNPAITRAKVRAFIQSHLQQKELEQKNIALQNLAMLVNNSIDLMCILDGKDLAVNQLNPAWEKLLGLENDQVLGHSINELSGAENGFSILEESKDQVVIFENKLSSVSGEIFCFNWSFVKKNYFWYGNGKNITKSKIIEQQLEKAKEELENKVNERTAD